MDRSLEVELGGRLEVSDKEAERRFGGELDLKSEDARWLWVCLVEGLSLAWLDF